MKKTEKIEIRVSPDEKEALSAASRAEGRTASEVLRGFVGRYVESSTLRTSLKKEKKMSWISKVVYVAIGAAVAAPLTLVAAPIDRMPDAFEAEVVIIGQPDEQTYPKNLEVETTLPIVMNGPSVIHAPHDGDDGYDIRAGVTEGERGVYDISFEICWQSASAECEFVSAPQITTAFADTVRLQVASRNGGMVYIRLEPVVRKK